MISPRARFLAALRENADAWHAAEIDYATFTECQQAVWSEIRDAGSAIEREVLQALRDQLPMSSRCGRGWSSGTADRAAGVGSEGAERDYSADKND